MNALEKSSATTASRHPAKWVLMWRIKIQRLSSERQMDKNNNEKKTLFVIKVKRLKTQNHSGCV